MRKFIEKYKKYREEILFALCIVALIIIGVASIVKVYGEPLLPLPNTITEPVNIDEIKQELLVIQSQIHNIIEYIVVGIAVLTLLIAFGLGLSVIKIIAGLWGRKI